MANNVNVMRFSVTDGVLSGPKQYMEEQGNARLDAILAGNDTVFNMCCGQSPNIETAICVMMQTDYASWAGMKQVEGWLKH